MTEFEFGNIRILIEHIHSRNADGTVNCKMTVLCDGKESESVFPANELGERLAKVCF